MGAFAKLDAAAAAFYPSVLFFLCYRDHLFADALPLTGVVLAPIW